jgi:DNA invertase Pin-like site-specific DNA recombinase
MYEKQKIHRRDRGVDNVVRQAKENLKCYHDGQSQRAIQRETGIRRKTIRKYIREYENKKAALLWTRDYS